MELLGLNELSNLGVAGFAILVMWWMYQSSSHRIDELNKEVRTEIMSQLGKNTSVMERIINHLEKK